MNYLDIEYRQQIKRMEKLGVNTSGQGFEQMVNTLLYMIETKQLDLTAVCECKGSGDIKMDGTCARCNKPAVI